MILVDTSIWIELIKGHLHIPEPDLLLRFRCTGPIVQEVLIRSSADCLIAAVSIETGAPVWHKDRDFKAIARFTPLRLFDVR